MEIEHMALICFSDLLVKIRPLMDGNIQILNVLICF